ncbi:hypothetical protein ACKQTC_08515 [Peptococcus simiae]|uniref:Uncharacterized protein n=1 Tax=Peptococcus simiae TaxID=1643805 RepID=A0ABW9H0N1_9FIRM
MSKEMAQGIVDEITERLMQPEAYRGMGEEFALITTAVDEEGNEGVNTNVRCGPFFLMNAIKSLTICLYEDTPDAVLYLLDTLIKQVETREDEEEV